jgi:hypothetical protein
MKLRYSLAALTVAISLYGCTSSSNPGVFVKLDATRQNAGQIGNVTKGSCQQPGPVAYAMNDRVTTERQPIRGWTFSRSAPVGLAELLASEHHIIVRTAATDGNVDIFCGDIKQTAASK